MTWAAAHVSSVVFMSTASAPRKEVAAAATRESLVRNCIVGPEQQRVTMKFGQKRVSGRQERDEKKTQRV
jgi:hypothetical protein